MHKKPPVISAAELPARLAAARQPFHDAYYAMYSSVLGGIVTDPVLMMIPVDDHLVHRGDGVFESIKCSGWNIYNLAAHLRRLQHSMKPLAIMPPCPDEELIELISDTVCAGGHGDSLIRLLISRGPGSLNVNPYDSPRSQIYIVASRLPPPFMQTHPRGARVETSAVPVKPSFFARVKTCNYLPNVLMKKEAVDRKVDFVVAFDTDGFLAEGATENVAVVTKDRILAYPHAAHILTGTTMIRVMELARPLVAGGLLKEVRQQNITREDLKTAGEVLILGTTVNVTAVVEYDGLPIGAGRPGPVYEALSKLLAEDMKSNSALLIPLNNERSSK